MTRTTDTLQASAESDLAYLKRMASAGRGAPAPFLVLMAAFGACFGLSFLAIGLLIQVYGAEAFMREDPGMLFRIAGMTPIVSQGVFLLALLWTAWRTFGPNRVKLSRAAVAVWSAAFIGLVTVVVAFNLYTRGEPATDQVYTAYMMSPVLLVLWGCAWWVTAILGERRWLLVVAVASFLAAVMMAVIGNTPPFLLASAACLLGLAFLPAVLLMRERRA